jgi:hypothetical protein
MTYLGAFAFGLVIGWFVYFTNRYRKGDVQFSDLITLVGIIGGGAVTALFGEGRTALFGAYGLGLAFGFFAYFVALFILVRNSGGAFGLTWFLDGRRKKLGPDEEIPGETRPTIAPMDMRPGFSERLAVLEDRLDRLPQPSPPAAAMAMPALAAPSPSPLADAGDQRQRAIAAIVEGLRELLRRIGETTDDAARARLQDAYDQLARKQDELVALRLKDILDSEQVKAALAKLRTITSDLEVEAKQMKTATDAVAAAAKIIGGVTRIVGLLGGLFA